MKPAQAIGALAALAQETRLAIFRLLVREGPAGLSAGAIADRLDVPAPTLSFHLTQLSRAGLLTSRRAGRSILYGFDPRGMNALLTYLTEDCCRGRPELCIGIACGPSAATADIGEACYEAPARVRRRAGRLTRNRHMTSA
jgi:DNA-binding transcriptional ArsR family regulator